MVILAIAVIIVALPQSLKGWLPGFVRSPALHLGLDLAGGTQLDFRISEEEIKQQLASLTQEIETAKANGRPSEEITSLENEKVSIELQAQNIEEAIRTVLERRINALGVSESTITPTYVGDERHLLVECPGVVDTQECIEVVGKTIQLEFKEELVETDENIKAEVRAKAIAALRRVTASGETLQKIGQDLGTDLGMSYQESLMLFRDQLPKGLESVWGATPGVVQQREGSAVAASTDEQGNPVEQEVPGIFLVETLGPLTSTGRIISEAEKAFTIVTKTEPNSSVAQFEEVLLSGSVPVRVISTIKTMQPGELKTAVMDDGTAKVIFLQSFTPGEEQVNVSHVLVTYKGASGAPASVTRTKAEALLRANELLAQIQNGATLESVARAESDGPSAQGGGSLGIIKRGSIATSFDAVAFGSTTKPGEVSAPVETPYGYHLIRVNSAPTATTEKASYVELNLTGANAPSRAGAIISMLQAGEIKEEQQAIKIRTLFFSFLPSGWKDTALDGKHFRSAAVTVDPVTNIPLVQIQFDSEGARLFEELTAKNVGKRIAIFVGGQLISAPSVEQAISGGTAVITGSRNFQEASALAQDLNTGAIPAPIYLVGQYTVEATLGAEALRTSLLAALFGTIILMLYMVVVYRGLGLVADIALTAYAVLLFAILKMPLLLISNTYIVLTLAGMAGIILSIGMAVDANVLVFERMKEEFRRGKSLKTAVETSFVYAWPAIRDSNISALITCAILFLIGTSIVRGFAITLGMGVLLSLFTAVTVTRWLLRKAAKLKIIEKNPGLLYPTAKN